MLVADLDAAVLAAPTHVSLYDLTYTPATSVPGGAQARRRRPPCGGGLRRGTLPHGRRPPGGRWVPALRGVELRAARARVASQHGLLAGSGLRRSGCGCGLHGGRAALDQSARRWRRTWPARLPTVEVLDVATRQFERAMLGLRTRAGVDEQSVIELLEPDALARLVASGHVERAYATLRLTPSGLDLSNTVLAQLLRFPDQEGSGRR